MYSHFESINLFPVETCTFSAQQAAEINKNLNDRGNCGFCMESLFFKITGRDKSEFRSSVLGLAFSESQI